MKLTQAQFEAAQDAIDNAIRSSKRGTPARTLAEALSAEWEEILSLPQTTFVQREARLTAIATFATRRLGV